MNVREYAVLDALNIASTIHSKRLKRAERWWDTIYQATAEQISVVLNTDERCVEDFGFQLTARQVESLLGQMNRGLPHRRAALVQRVGAKKWQLTDEGVGVLSA